MSWTRMLGILAGRLFVLGIALAAAAANGQTALNVSPTSAVSGGTVTAAWSGLPAPATNDWLGLYAPGAANTAYKSWRYTNGAASGSLPFTIPATLAPGTYELRLNNSGYTTLATSSSFTVTSGASLTVSPTSAVSGGTVTAAWSALPAPATTDWLGLYAPGAANTAYKSWRYTDGAASGNLPFTIPATLAPGTYELRLNNSGYITLATSSFTVTSGASLTASPTSVVPGDTVTAAWSGLAAPATTDWLGLYAPGAANTAYKSWRHTDGAASSSVPFTILPATLAPGTYELRLNNSGYATLATSGSLTVNASVSGTVTASGAPLAGVVFATTNGGACTSSNASGQYTCAVPPGWSGSVTPSPIGYSFTPASRSYSNVTTHQTAQNYAAASYQVSGTVTASGAPLAGVAFAGNRAACTSSNASGQYTCNVPQGWSGSVTASLSGYYFTPASRNYSAVAANQAMQDYAAGPTYQVVGTVTASGAPLAGVIFAAANGGACTSSNASGQYACTVPQGWSGSVTASRSGYAFAPASRNYSSVTADQTVQDYAATPAYRLSGTLTLRGLPLVGAAIAATNGATCTSSNASGQYECTVLQGWSGSTTPSLSGYSFTPPSRSHANVANNQTGRDFAAAVDSASAAIYYIHADHLNTPRLAADATGTTVWRWDQQEPFGSNPADENPSGFGAFDLPLRLPGQYFDKETNLHYNYFRDCYDPAMGRYCQSDPIGLSGGLNTYAYVGGNPIGKTDPTGLIADPQAPDLRGTSSSSASGSAADGTQVCQIMFELCENDGYITSLLMPTKICTYTCPSGRPGPTLTIHKVQPCPKYYPKF